MGTYHPVTPEEWMRQQEKDAILQSRRGAGTDLGYSGTYKTGLLAADWIGPGPAMVSLDLYGTTVGPAEWLTPWRPTGPRAVIVGRMEGEWVILGQTGDTMLGAPRRLPWLAGWSSYAESTAEVQWVNRMGGFTVWRTPAGIVQLSGLGRAGTVANGTVIGVLPEGFRPDTDSRFQCNVNDTARSVIVRANGNVELDGAISASQYLSLDNVTYPAAGVATWTPIGSGGTAFANGWQAYQAATWGTPAFWLDPFGVVWWRGCVSSGTNSLGTIIVSGSGTLLAYKDQHMSTAANGAFGALISRGTSTPLAPLVVGGGNASNTWVTLAGVTYVTVAGRSTIPWYAPPMANNWEDYAPATFVEMLLAQRADGLCMALGLIDVGSIGTVVTYLREHMRLPQRTLRQSYATDARARIDTTADGGLSANQGTNTWFSFSSMKWVAG